MLRQNIEVTQDKKLVNPAIHVVQGDTGRTVVALVKDATISGTATMAFERPDGATYTTTATVNSDNSVEATFTADMLRVAGTGKATFKVVSSGSQVSTYQLYVLVEPSAGFERPVTPSNNKIYVYVNGSPVEVATAAEVASKASQSQVDGISATVNNLVGRIVEDENNIAINTATLRNKMNKVRIDFDGTNFKIGTHTLNYKELYDIHISNPDFGFVVYGDRAYLLSYVQDGAGMKEMRFQSTIATTDSSNLSYTKTSGIYVTSSDGINIASVRVADINSENKSYKATEFTEANKNSDIWYPSNKAVNNVVSELKDDLAETESRLSESIVNIESNVHNITSEEDLNILDEVFEVGTINNQSGENQPSNTRIRTKNLIPIEPSVQYWFNTNGYGVYVYLYGKSKNFLRVLLGAGNKGIKDECITTDADVRYFRIRTDDDYGTVYKNDICVSKSDSYVPYIPHRIANDIVARNDNYALKLEVENIKSDMKKVSEPMQFMKFENVNGIDNGVQAIQDNIITRNGYQFCCYVNSNNKPEIAKRLVGSNVWEHKEISAYPSSITLDGHYYISMGMDEDGHIHLIGGSHATVMRYVRTSEPYNINTFFQVSPIIGDSEDRISYPCFVNDNLGRLYLFYRYTITNNSVTTNRYVLNIFDVKPTSHKWVRISPNIIEGTISTGVSGGYPYLNRIAVDKLGRIHISGCWRAGNNYDIFYLLNDNRGNALNWKKSNGESYTLPITRDTAEVVANISNPNNGLLNQNGMCTDENNNPHIVYFKIDDNNKTNIFHTYYDGEYWHEEKVTSFDYRINPNLTSYEGQLSRPSVFCYNNRIFLIYRHNFDGLGSKLRIRDITDNQKQKEGIIFDGELGTYEASYDTNSIVEGKLNMLICHTRTDINEALPADRWHNEDEWIKHPMSGVMCVDLNSIDEILNSKCRIPSISKFSNGNSIIVKGGMKHYIKLCMCRNSTANAKASVVVVENEVEKVLGSVYLYSSDTAMIKESNFLLLENDDDCVVKIKNDTSNIEFAYIVEAELDF